MNTIKTFNNRKDANIYWKAALTWLTERYGNGTFLQQLAVNELYSHFRYLIDIPDGYQFISLNGVRHHELWEGCMYAYANNVEDVYIVAFNVPDEYVALEMRIAT